jgi:phosphoenolpyruvate carboxylase
MSAEVKEVMDTCRTVAQLGRESLSAYVISMAKVGGEQGTACAC